MIDRECSRCGWARLSRALRTARCVTCHPLKPGEACHPHSALPACLPLLPLLHGPLTGLHGYARACRCFLARATLRAWDDPTLAHGVRGLASLLDLPPPATMREGGLAVEATAEEQGGLVSTAEEQGGLASVRRGGPGLDAIPSVDALFAQLLQVREHRCGPPLVHPCRRVAVYI